MKKLNFNIKDRKVLYGILTIALVCVFSLTIVYAALSVTLNITGNAKVVASTWDIHLDNVKVTSGSVSGTTPSITSPTTATFSTALNMPGDFYEFTIDVVNDGSIDAMIDDITKTPTLTETQAKYLNYIIEYQNGESINTKQLVEKESFVRLKVRVEFRKDVIASDMPTASETLNLAFTVNYVQSDGTASSVTDNSAEKKLINVVSGDGSKTSDEVCIGEECFYVMYSDETTVTMLAKYNLYVGGQYTTTSGAYIEYGTIATGIQNYNMIGYTDSGAVRKGTIAYSTNSSTYSASIVKTHVDNYANHLKSLGAAVISAKLLEKTELEKLGCSGTSCTTAPSWVYSTSYWTGTSYDLNNVYYVVSNGYFSKTTYTNNYGYGVRPLVKISLSDAGINNSTITVVSGNLDTPGSEVCIKDECFYVLSSTTTTVKLLAKYNLYLGGVYANSTYTSYGAGASGIQNVSMVGYIPGLDVRNGVTTFSNSNYWYSGGLKAQYGTTFPAYVYDTNASFYEGIENYKNYLIIIEWSE